MLRQLLAVKGNMNIPKISKRLEAAASFLRSGAGIADVGTDHAYLPIYLYAAGRIKWGIATDINNGPVERARLNIKGYGIKDITVIQTDGLYGVEAYAPEDIFILGMGGELIVHIISEAEWLCSPRFRLILQPMTHPEAVRAWLSQNGFSVVDECLVEDEKIYQIICAEYTGKHTQMSVLELMLGKLNLARGGELVTKLLLHTKAVYQKRIKGKKTAGADYSEDAHIIEKIDKYLTENI